MPVTMQAHPREGGPTMGHDIFLPPNQQPGSEGFCYINMNINSLSWIELPFSFLSAPLSLQVQIRMASFMCLYCQSVILNLFCFIR